jgi:predicted amidohydrolase
MRVALLQYPIAWADKETNLHLAEERIAALAGQADVAVLPEMFATGFCTDHPELAESMDGDIIRRLQAAADQSGVAIVSSFICAPDTRAKLRNRGFMIKPHQKPITDSEASDNRYPIEIQDKRHLYAHGGEDLFFQPAQERHIFEYKGVKFQLLVCYDLRFPVWARNQSGYDYDIILVVANWPDIRIQYWDALIAARATENQCYIAAVNCVGDDGMGLHYNGHSVAYDTRLQPIVSFADDEEGTKIADFDIAKLHHFREVLPLWKDVDQFKMQMMHHE